MQLPMNIGRYQLVEYLGGGMSHVYRAHDTVIGRSVAVKILTDASCQDSEAKARFLAEARVAGNIAHHNLLSIYDFGEDEHHRRFMVMELLRGEDLRSAIKHGHTGDVRCRLKIAVQVARALEYLHNQKVIHRDIKPENIHINTAGVVKLMDFGIAKAEGPGLTRAGYVLGTPHYMAPEQVMGKDVTCQVDVYSFGILLFELMTTVRPISGDSVERIFYSILNEPLNLAPMREAGVSRPISDLVAKCTAKNPAERPQGFAPVCAELERAIAELEAPNRALTASLGAQSAAGQTRGRIRRYVLVAVFAGVMFVLASVGLLGKRANSAGAAAAVNEVGAEYARDALSPRFQGSVTFDAVVDGDRGVRDMKAVGRVGMGLDEKAKQVLQRCAFRPAGDKGYPGPCKVTLTFAFPMN